MKSNKNKRQSPFIEHVLSILSHCSLGCLFRLAKVISFVIARTKNQVSKQTQQNISVCFTHLSKHQQKKFYKQSVTHTSSSLIEMALLWHQPMSKVLQSIKHENVCADYFDNQDAKIIVAPHFGSWEMLNLWLAQQGNFYSLYKPARSTKIDRYVLSKRTRNGATLVPTNVAGLRTLLKALKAGATVMILPDQKPSKDSAGILSHFYQQPTLTSLLIKNLSKKIKCSIYIGAALRNLDQASFNISLQRLEADQFLASDQASADYLNQSIEQFIQQDEVQYQWSYRRFTKRAYENLGI